MIGTKAQSPTRLAPPRLLQYTTVWILFEISEMNEKKKAGGGGGYGKDWEGGSENGSSV